MGLFSRIASFCTNAVNAVKSFFSGSGGDAVSRAISSYSGYNGYSGGGSSSSTTTITRNYTSHSTTTTTYDPDRVRAAEIEYAGKIKLAAMEKEKLEYESRMSDEEYQRKLKLAGMEKERLEYAKQAQLDIIEAQTQSRIAQEQARAEGFERIAEAITDMQERLNVIAERRITIIERGTLQAVREAESFYAELTAKIQQDNDKYTAEKLPALLDMLGRYEQGTSAHTLFMKKIEDDISIQAKHTTRQLESVLTRQERMIDEIMTAKGRISEQTSQITAAMLEAVKEKIEELDTSKPILPALPE